MRNARVSFAILALLLATTMLFSCETVDTEDVDDPVEANDPPEAPHTPYPENHVVGQSIRPIFYWQCEDPELDELTFTIYLTRAYDYYDHDPIVTSDRSYAMDLDLEKQRRYDWHVEADDGNNDPVSSETWTFYTGETTNNPPFPPFNPDPPDYATDVQAEDVTLSWEGYDPDGDPLVYDVWLEVHYGAGEFIVENHPDAFYNIGRLGTGVDFRWYVIVKDDQGGTASNHDNEWRFETEEANDPPEMPYDPTPADNETDVAIDELLVWHCSDPNGDPLTYDVWFGPPLIPMLVSAGQSETTYLPTAMIKDHEYEWWIVAHDDEGAETQGPFWSFTTANEIYVELEILRTINSNYGLIIRDDMIKARFDATYAPDIGIYPLQPSEVWCDIYTLYWLDFEQIYFYRDPENDPFIELGHHYGLRAEPGGGVDNVVHVIMPMPDCEAYFTSPEDNTSVSLIDGFEVQWESSCPGTGTVDLYVRNDMGEDIGIHRTTENDGAYTFGPEELSPALGSMQIFVDIVAENSENIELIGCSSRSVWRARISCTRMLYAM